MKDKNIIDLAKKYFFIQLSQLIKNRKKVTDKEKEQLFFKIVNNLKKENYINSTKGNTK